MRVIRTMSKKAIGIVALLAFVGIAAAAGGQVTGRDVIGPIPVPTTDEDLLLIDQTICDCWTGLGQTNNGDALLGCLIETLHPDIPFPPIEGDHVTVFQVYELFAQRVASFMSSPDKANWCPDAGGPGTVPPQPTMPGFVPTTNPLDLLGEMLMNQPRPGYMFQISNGDTLSATVRAALNSVVPGAGEEGDNRLQYIKCITSGPGWNWPLYASSSFSTPNFPSYYGVNGMGLRRAFYPWHENAKVAISQNRMPNKGITPGGSKVDPAAGSSYAMLWLPPVDAAALSQGIVTCGLLEHSDGSSSINPPPELMSLLAGS